MNWPAAAGALYCWHSGLSGSRRYGKPMGATMLNFTDRRERMIAETSAFLTWALANNVDLPRIPRRRVSIGGFSVFADVPGARAAMSHWWGRALDMVDRVRY